MRRILILAAAALIALGCSGAPDTDPVKGVPGQDVKPTAVAKPGQYGDGTYEVGTDIKPGKYRTTVPGDALNCYWARLKNMSSLNINDNGNLAPGAKGLIQVLKTDVAVQFSGGCVWTVSK